VVGKRGWLYDDFFQELERSPVRHAVRFPGYVPDADLPACYGGAQALVLPSLYEGFGLPVLEAMACGTPVVCADRASLPEIAGEAAVLADPEDEQALAAAMARVIEDLPRRRQMQALGLERARRFSWQATAQATLAIYEQVMGPSSR
jgi:glycosyltransferase involved in cell wall biosynthesis